MRALRGSADALGQRDDDPFRSPDVGHSPSALVLADAADQSVALGSCPIDSVWSSTDLSLLRASSSTDGVHWSLPVTVNTDRTSTTQVVNADVAAFQGKVLVSYGVRNMAAAEGRFVQQQTAISYDRGGPVGVRLPLGPVS